MNKSFLLFAGVLIVLSACSDQNEGAANPESASQEREPKPVTLHVFTDASASIDIEQELVKKKFPHITLEIIKNGKDTRIENVVSSGQQLDLINHSMGSIWKLYDLQLMSDLTPFINAQKFDLTTFQPGVAEAMRSYSDKGEMLALPYELNANVLFYNKTIFNKFGVSFPKDGMTWEETYELAKRLTKMEGGVQYKGFQFQQQNLTWKNQLGLPLVDPATKKALVNGDGWKAFLEGMGRFYLIPGNEYDGVSDTEGFTDKQNVAMRVGPNILARVAKAAAEAGLDWDLISVPVFDRAAGSGSQLIAPFYSIPVGGKHKEEAFRVMAYLLSPEVQLHKSRTGRMPIINDQTAIRAFASEIEGTEQKNIAAFFKEGVGKPIRATPYDGIAKDELWKKALPAVYTGQKDVNTALREAEESIHLQISSLVR
ncbi:carbohydrate ABC transporter substrate-binding protein [Paenibacillus hemerocallicola]|uniref:Carbohydrate ABC transporter substrate-binding protein n=1 Tax=Paenibacillus hemerocallicola TaxID=1172614 RepID=A0A5C4T1C0_9BACL|nr:ABC transporter substrate-binding protein [Paenibacillus hemerocallicola]TNJ62773.1 carbohydrate ABC transporter substrate-binding protein [Paenibacillus hemerocallicola]